MKKVSLMVLGLLQGCFLFAQDSAYNKLLPMHQETDAGKVYGIFKSTRVINAQSVEMLHKGSLDLRIMHRFGYVNEGLKQLFGLDEASMRLGFDYGVSDNFTVGIGRSTFRKELDGFVKWRLMQQSTGEKPKLISLVIVAGSTVWTEKSFVTPAPSFADRVSYYLKLLAGGKFIDKF